MKKMKGLIAWLLVFVMALSGNWATIPAQVQAAEVSDASVDALNALIETAADGEIVKLNVDLTVGDDRIEFDNGKNITLDLNGHTITGTDTENMGSVILVSNGTKLTLMDSANNASQSSKFSYNIVKETKKENSTETEWKPIATDYVGGGITLASGTTANHIIYIDGTVAGTSFTMDGGAIYGGKNEAGSGENGAGIYAKDATVTLNSGVIANNTADNFGGGIAVEHSVLEINAKAGLDSVVISGNEAANRGGGIYAYNGPIADANNNGVINSKAELGKKGNLDNSDNKSTVTINDPNCYITDNHAYKQADGVIGTHLDCGGGGLRLDDDTVFVMNGGYITGNTSGAGGGGIMAGYYNTTGWTDASGYAYIPAIDHVFVTINAGTISANTSQREGAGVSIGGNCSGIITGGTEETGTKDVDTYITHNVVADNTTDWGGGGLFVAAASSAAETTLLDLNLTDYIDPGSMSIRKAVITNNTALGFGGGVAGCATARVFINPEQMDTNGNVSNADKIKENGVAIYANKATATPDDNYVAKQYDQSGTDHLSGATSDKNEDHTYTDGNEVFWKNEFNDYFCALNTQVGNTMLGGGTANWTGSADSVYVARDENYTDKDKNIYASYLAGLTAHPTEDATNAATTNAKVYITDNSSGTHGGGILANGVLVLGEPSTSLEVQDRIIINASKVVKDKNKNIISHTADGFTFDVFQYDGEKIAELQSSTSATNSDLGEIDTVFAYNGKSEREDWDTYTYFIAERGNEDGIYSADRDVYYISIKGGRDKNESAGDAFGEDTVLSVGKIQQVCIIKRTLTPDQFSYAENGTPTLLVPLATGIDSKTLSEEEAKLNDAKNDELWRGWQKTYTIHKTDGSTYHGYADESIDDLEEITNDNVSIVLDYAVVDDVNNDGVNDANASVMTINDEKYTIQNGEITIDGDTIKVSDIINLSTGTDHAKLLNLNALPGTEGTFVNVENKTDVTVKVEWKDVNGQTVANPPAVTLEVVQTVTKGGTTTEKKLEKTITLDGTEDKNGETVDWEAAFADLPKTDPEGYEYEYHVVQKAADTTDDLSDYTTTYENLKNESGDEITGEAGEKTYALNKETITNQYDPSIDISGTITWDDDNNQDGKRPAEVTVTVDLYQNGQLVEGKSQTQTVEPDANGDWKFVFQDLEKYDENGNAYTYEVTESTVDSYTTSITSQEVTGGLEYQITNVTISDEVAGTVLKLNKKDQNGNVVQGAIFQLWDGNEKLAEDTSNDNGEVTLTLEGEDLWADQVARTLSLVEIAPDGYTGAGPWIVNMVSAGTSTENVEGAQVNVYKWKVDSINNGSNTLTATNGVYTVINTKDEIKTSVSGTVTWVDDNNANGSRPTEVTVRLYADNKPTDSTVTISAANGWQYEFEDLDKYTESGNLIKYTVYEDAVNGYETTYDETHLNITNKYPAETTSVTVLTTWDDAENKDGIRPESITVQLTKNGEDLGDPVTLNADNNWSYIWENLAISEVDGDGNVTPITYDIKEIDDIDGYETKVEEQAGENVIVITNKHDSATTDVTVTIKWEDSNDSDGVRPTADEFKDKIHLKNGDAVIGGYVPTVTDNGDGTYTVEYKDLPKNIDGTPADYSVVEDLPTGYNSDSISVKDGEVITNSHVPEVVSIIITKTWNDGNNKDGIRPSAEEFKKFVHLMTGDKEVTGVTPTVTDNKNGTYTVRYDNLPKYENGVEILYSVSEDTISGYTAQYGGSAAEGFTITNTHTPKQDESSTDGDDKTNKDDTITDTTGSDKTDTDKSDSDKTDTDKSDEDETDSDKSDESDSDDSDESDTDDNGTSNSRKDKDTVDTGDHTDAAKLKWVFVGMLLLAAVLFLLGRKYEGR